MIYEQNMNERRLKLKAWERCYKGGNAFYIPKSTDRVFIAFLDKQMYDKIYIREILRRYFHFRDIS